MIHFVRVLVTAIAAPVVPGNHLNDRFMCFADMVILLFAQYGDLPRLSNI